MVVIFLLVSSIRPTKMNSNAPSVILYITSTILTCASGAPIHLRVAIVFFSEHIHKTHVSLPLQPLLHYACYAIT